MRDYISYHGLLEQLDTPALRPWREVLPAHIEQLFLQRNHGDYKRWLAALDSMPDFRAASVDLNGAAITVGAAENFSDDCRTALQEGLRGLMPWRKGPYDIAGVYIDTEWRSDWKWDRIAPHLSPLAGRKVIDIGCGSGYHLWRMAGAGAELVIGVEPSPLFNFQFWALQRYIDDRRVHMAPVGIQHMPPKLEAFDSCFSMGVLYHRPSPFEHLFDLKDLLCSGGELILETLVIEGGEGQVLVPEGRYASMNNVWFLPSCKTLESWLRKAGFADIRLVDVNQTSLQEQRRTDWMQFYSLENFLDDDNHKLTIEGHPAPRRAVFVATKP